MAKVRFQFFTKNSFVNYYTPLMCNMAMEKSTMLIGFFGILPQTLRTFHGDFLVHCRIPIMASTFDGSDLRELLTNSIENIAFRRSSEQWLVGGSY